MNPNPGKIVVITFLVGAAIWGILIMLLSGCDVGCKVSIKVKETATPQPEVVTNGR